MTSSTNVPAEPDTIPGLTVRQRLAAELQRLAGDIVRLDLPVGDCPSLRLGVLDSRADLDPWADYLGTSLDPADSTGIPSITVRIRLGDGYHRTWLTIGVQAPKDELSELEAQQGGESK